MEKWIVWVFWRMKTSTVLILITILSTWLVAYYFLSTIKHTNKKDTVSCATDDLFTSYESSTRAMTNTPELNVEIYGEVTTTKKPVRLKDVAKQEKDINFRNRFFDWQDSKADLDLNIGPDLIINASKYFIYRCDSNTMKFCGGWGDRIKGIAMAYLIANLTGRVFKIELSNPPCNIAEMLVPNLVNWSLPTPFHKIVIPKKSSVIRANMVGNLTFVRELEFMNLTQWLGTEAEFVYFKANAIGIEEFQKSRIYKQRVSWMKNLRHGDVLAVIFKRLFKLSVRLNNKVKMFLGKMTPTDKHKLICAHVRVGKNPTNPLDNIVITSDNEIPHVWTFLKNQSKTDLQSVFFMSDSDDVIEEAKLQGFGQRLFITPGTVVHIDKVPPGYNHELCEGLEKVLFDQHVLMACDVLLVGRSGLSKIAASVRGDNRGLYELKRNGIVAPMRL